MKKTIITILIFISTFMSTGCELIDFLAALDIFTHGACIDYWGDCYEIYDEDEAAECEIYYRNKYCEDVGY